MRASLTIITVIIGLLLGDIIYRRVKAEIDYEKSAREPAPPATKATDESELSDQTYTLPEFPPGELSSDTLTVPTEDQSNLTAKLDELSYKLPDQDTIEQQITNMLISVIQHYCPDGKVTVPAKAAKKWSTLSWTDNEDGTVTIEITP